MADLFDAPASQPDTLRGGLALALALCERVAARYREERPGGKLPPIDAGVITGAEACVNQIRKTLERMGDDAD